MKRLLLVIGALPLSFLFACRSVEPVASLAPTITGTMQPTVTSVATPVVQTDTTDEPLPSATAARTTATTVPGATSEPTVAAVTPAARLFAPATLSEGLKEEIAYVAGAGGWGVVGMWRSQRCKREKR